jgi:hypothetical protein
MNRKGMARYLSATGVLLAPHITASITLAVIVGALLADATTTATLSSRGHQP